MTDENELRDVPGYPNYQVTCDGRIWTVGRPRVRDGWMKLSTHAKGYRFTMGRVDGRQVPLYAHRLVALAWIGPPPTPEHQVCHNDGDPSNNHVDNLRWGTVADNARDAVRHGTSPLLRKNRDARESKMQGLRESP